MNLSWIIELKLQEIGPSLVGAPLKMAMFLMLKDPPVRAAHW